MGNISQEAFAVLQTGNKLEPQDIGGVKGVEMFATALSQAEDLLLVREQGASLPNLGRRGRYAAKNVRLIAQLEGEGHEQFVSRVLARAPGGLANMNPVRSAVACLRANSTPAMDASRVRLLRGIASALASRPDSELVILAPQNASASERIRLFELVEATLQAVPHQNVRLNFAPLDPPLAPTAQSSYALA